MNGSFQHVQAQKVIVIHPGSLNLRIGRASDLNPVVILHAIGRRRRLKTDSNEYTEEHSDNILPPIQARCLPEFYGIRQKLLHQGRNFGTKKQLESRSQSVINFNKKSVPKEINCENVEAYQHMTQADRLEDTIFDKDILELEEDNDFIVSLPIRRGELNVHNGIGGSLAAVLDDLEKIWLYALNKCMNISTKSLHEYAAVLIVTDLYNRSHFRELTTLLLQHLGFRSCLLIQDHVASLFGAGLGYACVVDIGDQKTAISCVEDGVSHIRTRVRLLYGGGDLTQVFNALLQKCNFPYKDCDGKNTLPDAKLLMELKEQFCHLNLDTLAIHEKSFQVKRRDKCLQYTIQLADECILTPLSLFHTEFMNITGRQNDINLQLSNGYLQDPEDCFGDDYLRDTGKRNGREQSIEGAMPITGDAEDEMVADSYDVEKDVNIKVNEKDETTYKFIPQILPLDQAIVRSIERCSNEELKRKMYSCILLVGGGVKILGLPNVLEQKVKIAMATERKSNVSQFEVNIMRKDVDASMIAWKGASIMSCLESAGELWVTQEEWKKLGLRVLREKATFIW